MISIKASAAPTATPTSDSTSGTLSAAKRNAAYVARKMSGSTASKIARASVDSLNTFPGWLAGLALVITSIGLPVTCAAAPSTSATGVYQRHGDAPNAEASRQPFGHKLPNIEVESRHRSSELSTQAIQWFGGPSLGAKDRNAAEDLTRRVSASEWLGPLAPVALSPFFGLTCLSGMAIFGENWLPDGHTMTQVSAPLRNPIVFFTFLTLTLLTSLPRFSKVSKPFAQSVDRLEAYAGIITLLIIRYVGKIELGEAGEPAVATVFHAGIFEFSAETLLTLVTIMNVLVINAVKFFFEVMVWITPVPLIDAAFEIANKSLCAALMAVYAYSPFAAMLINLLILAVCAISFVWIRRREVFFRTIMLEFFSWLMRRNQANTNERVETLTVFPDEDIDEIPKLGRCTLDRNEAGTAWTLTHRRLLRKPIVKQWTAEDTSLRIEPGIFRNQLVVDGTTSARMIFGRKYQRTLAEVAEQFKATLQQEAQENVSPKVAFDSVG